MVVAAGSESTLQISNGMRNEFTEAMGTKRPGTFGDNIREWDVCAIA